MKSPDIFSCHLADLCHLINCMFVKSMFFPVHMLLLCQCQSSVRENSSRSQELSLRESSPPSG